jgi:regulator of microtubule dynamics protein 3
MHRNSNWVFGILLLAVILMFVQDPAEIYAQNISESDISELLERASELKESADEPAARELFEEVIEYDPLNFKALWNLSILYSMEGHRLDDQDEMESYYSDAIELAERAIEYYPNEPESHYAYAVAIGRMSDISSPRERIRASEEIRESVERALELNADHAGAWHLLGIWHKRAANLSRAERWAANLLFGGAPEGASNEEAENSLKKAISLDPDNILFNLDLARFYITVEQYDHAIDVLERTIALEPKEMDDPDLLAEARDLLDELK